MGEGILQTRSFVVGSNRQSLVYYIGFMVWPFGTMIDALRRWRQPWAKNIFWLFCVFFGYTFIIADNIEGSADSARYMEVLAEYRTSNMDIKALFKSFYFENSSNVDIAQPLITFLVSRFTSNPRILFAFFALIFGFFHSRNIWYVLSKMNRDPNLFLILYLFVFILLNPIWSINGFRMWTGAQIFIFGLLPYLLEGKTKMLPWSLLAVLFHFSFSIPLIILLIYLIFKNRINIYFALFIITSFLKEIDLYAVQSYLSFLPSVFQSRASGYTNIDYAESVAMAGQALNWYLPLASKGLTWVIYMIVIYIYAFSRDFLKQKGLLSLFCFSVLLYSAANILSLVPSGGRFINVASTLLFAFFILYFSFPQKTTPLNILKAVSVPLLLLFTLVMMRAGMDYFGMVTIIGNPVFAGLGATSAPLITEIKGFL
jgi:hypothetical protein